MLRPMPDGSPPLERRAKLFRNGRNQAVRIPREFEIPGEEVTVRQEGERLVIEPLKRKMTLTELLDTLEPIEEDFDFPEDLPPGPVEL
jgi:antitoxin VapB